MSDINNYFSESGGNHTLTLGRAMVGSGGTFGIPGTEATGIIILNDKGGRKTIELDGEFGVLRLGGDKEDGDIIIYDYNDVETIRVDGKTAAMRLGNTGAGGDLRLRNSSNVETIHIDGQNGDIHFKNADFAEDFNIAPAVMEEVQAGSVMVMAESGDLVPCEGAYDSRVVGVISGAGTFKPGIVMDKNGDENRLPIAMMGKVYCYVDATEAPVEPGDMLTTSPLRGHAMKATDASRAFGTVIGKAMGRLESGTGLIPVLVNLQ